VQKCITQKVQTREQLLNEIWEMDLEVGPRPLIVMLEKAISQSNCGLPN
jgi:hypothetical protein